MRRFPFGAAYCGVILTVWTIAAAHAMTGPDLPSVTLPAHAYASRDLDAINAALDRFDAQVGKAGLDMQNGPYRVELRLVVVPGGTGVTP